MTSGGGHVGGTAIERLLFLNVLLGEPVESAIGEMTRQGRLDGRTEAIHPRGEELQNDERAEAIDHQPTQPVALGMDEAIGVADCVESEPVAAQGDRLPDAASEESVVDRLGRIAGQHAQGDA